MTEDLYKRVILDHYRRPRHGKPLAHADVEVPATNPVCGDAVVLQVRWHGDRLAELAHFGRGCTLCLASGSILTEFLLGRTQAEALAALATFEQLMAGAAPGSDVPTSVAALQGVLAYPARVTCVRMAWDALAQALRQWPPAANA